MTHEQEEIEEALQHLMTIPMMTLYRLLALLQELSDEEGTITTDDDAPLPETLQVNPDNIEWMDEEGEANEEDAAEPYAEHPGEIEFSRDEFDLVAEEIEE